MLNRIRCCAVAALLLASANGYAQDVYVEYSNDPWDQVTEQTFLGQGSFHLPPYERVEGAIFAGGDAASCMLNVGLLNFKWPQSANDERAQTYYNYTFQNNCAYPVYSAMRSDLGWSGAMNPIAPHAKVWMTALYQYTHDGKPPRQVRFCKNMNILSGECGPGPTLDQVMAKAKPNSCHKDGKFMASKLPQFNVPTLEVAKQAFADLDIPGRMLAVNGSGLTPKGAIRALLNDARAYDANAVKAAEVAPVFVSLENGDDEMFVRRLKDGTLSVPNCEGTMNSALCAGMSFKIMAYGLRATAAEMQCFLSADAWPGYGSLANVGGGDSASGIAGTLKAAAAREAAHPQGTATQASAGSSGAPSGGAPSSGSSSRSAGSTGASAPASASGLPSSTVQGMGDLAKAAASKNPTERVQAIQSGVNKIFGSSTGAQPTRPAAPGATPATGPNSTLQNILSVTQAASGGKAGPVNAQQVQSTVTNILSIPGDRRREGPTAEEQRKIDAASRSVESYKQSSETNPWGN